MCVYIYNEKKLQVLSTLSKVLKQLKIPFFYYEKVIPGKSNVKIHLAVGIIQEKQNAINVSTV